MTDSQRIAKLIGVRDGIRLTIDPRHPPETLIQEVTELFRQMQHLATDAQVWVETGGEPPDSKTLERLATTLKKDFAIRSIEPLPLI